MTLTSGDVNDLLSHLLDQQTCPREALARSVKEHIAKDHAEVGAAYEQEEDER